MTMGTVEGNTYSGTYYFRAYGEEDAREQVLPWRDRKLIVHYYPGNPTRSILNLEEQSLQPKSAGAN